MKSKFNSCGKCNNGYIYGQDRNGEEVVATCRCRKDFIKRKKIEIYIGTANLPPSVIDYDISSYVGEDEKRNIPRIKEYIKNFRDKFHIINLYVWSKSNSTQKTTVVQWMGRELLTRGHSVRFILMDDLVKLLQKSESYSVKEEIELKVRVLSSVDLLIIDDSFDKEKVTLYRSKYQLPFLDSFLRKRMEVFNKATIFTSNIPVNKIDKEFGISIKSLIDRNTSNLSGFKMEFIDGIWKKDNFSGPMFHVDMEGE